MNLTMHATMAISEHDITALAKYSLNFFAQLGAQQYVIVASRREKSREEMPCVLGQDFADAEKGAAKIGLT